MGILRVRAGVRNAWRGLQHRFGVANSSAWGGDGSSGSSAASWWDYMSGYSNIGVTGAHARRKTGNTRAGSKPGKAGNEHGISNSRNRREARTAVQHRRR